MRENRLIRVGRVTRSEETEPVWDGCESERWKKNTKTEKRLLDTSENDLWGCWGTWGGRGMWEIVKSEWSRTRMVDSK